MKLPKFMLRRERDTSQARDHAAADRATALLPLSG
jgi:hypothetical protein